MTVLNTWGQPSENNSISVYSWIHFFFGPVINWCSNEREYIKMCDRFCTRMRTILQILIYSITVLANNSEYT